MVKKAMILAAGLGSRLKTLTADRPKALVEVAGKTMLGRLIEKLKSEGIEHFMINIHHHGELILDYLENKNNFGVLIEISDEREELLDTGGAIKKADLFFDGEEPILIQNVDVISEVNLKLLTDYHLANKALCTLCVRQRESGRGLIFDRNMQLKGWVNHAEKKYKWVTEEMPGLKTYAFSGMYMVQPNFAEVLPYSGNFSIIDAWLSMAKTNKIMGFDDLSENWFDIGTKEKIEKAEAYLNKH